MTRTDLLEKICYTDYTNDCSACDGRYNCQDCKDAINPLLDEYDKQIRADAIDDVLFYLYDKNYINSDDEAYFRRQLKEQKE